MRVGDTAIGLGAILFGIAVILYSWKTAIRGHPSFPSSWPCCSSWRG
jgi:hypothetical protein